MQPGAVEVEVAMFNPGLTTITDLIINYQVDNQTVQSAPVSGLGMTFIISPSYISFWFTLSLEEQRSLLYSWKESKR